MQISFDWGLMNRCFDFLVPLVSFSMKRPATLVNMSMLFTDITSHGFLFKDFRHLPLDPTSSHQNIKFPTIGLKYERLSKLKTQYLCILDVSYLFVFHCRGNKQLCTGALRVSSVCELGILTLKRQVSAAVSSRCGTSWHIPESYFLFRKTSIFTRIHRSL